MTDKTYPLTDRALGVGPVPAVVLAVLAESCGAAGTTNMSYAEIAKRAGISHIGARRAVYKLGEAGLIKAEAKYLENRQCANLYHVLTTAGHFVPPAHIERAKVEISTSCSSSLIERQEVGERIPAVSEASGALTGTEVSLTGQEDSRLRRGQPGDWQGFCAPPPGTPMPKRPDRPNIFSISEEAGWLVMFFGGYILDQINEERRRLGRQPLDAVNDPRRLKGWFKSAEVFLLRRPAPPALEEISETIAWVFSECGGYLPVEVVNEFSPTGRTKPQDRKLTRLKQLFDNYDRIKEAIATGKTMHPQDLADRGHQSPVIGLDAKVAELVQLFIAFRWMPPDNFRRENFATTFRTMLAHDRRGFDDIKFVLTHLGSPPVLERLDVSRYQDAYWLRQEFDHVHELVTAVLAAEARKPTTPALPDEPKPATLDQLRAIGMSTEWIDSYERRALKARRQSLWDDDELCQWEETAEGNAMAGWRSSVTHMSGSASDMVDHIDERRVSQCFARLEDL